MSGRFPVVLATLVVLASVARVLGQPSSFDGIGLFSPERPRSWAWGISADGATVVTGFAYRWTREYGLEPLPLPPEPLEGVSAAAVSEDGGVIVGPATVADASCVHRLAQGNYEIIGPCGVLEAWAVSDAGDRVPISSTNFGSAGTSYLWRAGAPLMAFGPPPWSPITWCRGISGDGRVIVGGGFRFYPIPYPGFLWTEEDGFQWLGDLPGGGDSSTGVGASYDGSIVVGYSHSGNNADPFHSEAFCWSAAAGMEGLGDLPGGAFNSQALDVSADGVVVVGWGTTDQGQEAFIWDPGDRMRLLRQVLAEDGLEKEVAGWLLQSATGISADGRTICGDGINPMGQQEGWVAQLTPPCPADFNNDDMLNSQDFFDFLLCFFDPSACPPLAADFNGDEAITTQDFFDFLEAFFAGCP
jgi:probable HAF family extracellular repeat protein